MADEIVTLLKALVQRLDDTLPNLATKDDIARLDGEIRAVRDEVAQVKEEVVQVKDEQRQMKEMLGVVRMREIGRLDGRIDELTQVVAMALKPAAE